MADVLGFFKKSLPFLATAASMTGFPPAVMAANVAGKLLGKDVKPEDLPQTIQDLSLTEDGRLKLQEMENEMNKSMTQLGYDHAEKLAELEMQDRASARDREKGLKDHMPAVLATLAVVQLIFSICIIVFTHPPEGVKEALVLLIGFVGAAYKDVYAYYFGSSAGSDRKTELLVQNNPPSK